MVVFTGFVWGAIGSDRCFPMPSWLPSLLVFLEDAETGRRPAKLFNVNAHCTVADTMAGRSVTSRDNARVVGAA